jgi:hypothetical protein
MATIYQQFLPEEGQPLSTLFPQYVKNNGTAFPVSGLAYDAATKETIFFKWHATSYGSGNLTLQLFWYADTASTGDVIWGAQISAITSDTDTQDIETKALATANTVTDTHLGTVGQRLHQCSITITNLDSIASGDVVWLAVYRDSAAGGDTMAGDGILVEALLSYSDT